MRLRHFIPAFPALTKRRLRNTALLRQLVSRLARLDALGLRARLALVMAARRFSTDIGDQPRFAAQRSIRIHLLAGLTLVAMLSVGVGGWATQAEVAGAVIAPGTLVVDTSVKKVEHPTGGVVRELNVRDGDSVKVGQILVRLDDTQARASLGILVNSLDEFAARRAREIAEQDGANAIRFPDELVQRAREVPQVAQLLAGEERLFTIRRAAREGQKAQLRERVQQTKEEIQGLAQQATAKAREIELVQLELEGIRDLYSKHLVPLTRLNLLERDAARIGGERGQLIAQIAQARGKVTETELQMLQLDQDLRSEVGKDLADLRAKTSENEEKRIAAEDQLSRMDLRAPQDGIVHQLRAHTVGGLVTPTEPVMLIVPQADQLTVEVKIQPQDIDHVREGQSAGLRFSAFNQRTTPELDGMVQRVSADTSQDTKSGAAFYTARISLSEKELARLGGVRLVPGMPVESFIKTGDRTVLSYLVKPLSDQINRAFRSP